MVCGTPSWRIADISPNLSIRTQFFEFKRSALNREKAINPAQHQSFWELSHSTTVILYKNDRSFLRYATLRAIPRPHCSLLSLDLRLSAKITCRSRAINDDIIEPGKRVWRADGEVFHHEPTSPCCHRFRGFRCQAATGDYTAGCTKRYPGTNGVHPA